MVLSLARKLSTWIQDLLQLKIASQPNGLTNRLSNSCKSLSNLPCWLPPPFSSRSVLSCWALTVQCSLLLFSFSSCPSFRLPWFRRRPSFLLRLHRRRFLFQWSFRLEGKLGNRWIRSVFWPNLSIFFIREVRRYRFWRWGWFWILCRELVHHLHRQRKFHLQWTPICIVYLLKEIWRWRWLCRQWGKRSRNRHRIDRSWRYRHLGKELPWRP